MSNIFYIDNVFDRISQGWVKIKFKDNKAGFLCYQTKIKLLKNDPGYFIIAEGLYKGEIAKFFHKSYSEFEIPMVNKVNLGDKVVLILDKRKKKLEIKGLDIFDVVLNNFQLSKGEYFINLPDFPHDKTPSNYLNEDIGGSRFAKSWFRIENLNWVKTDMYIHFGLISDGCITIKLDTKKNSPGAWNDIYLHLITGRIDDEHIGVLLIK